MTGMLKPYNNLGYNRESTVKNENCYKAVASMANASNVPDGMPVGELFNALMNSSPLGLYILQDGKFKFISDKFAEILGYNWTEIVTGEALRYVYPEDRDTVRENAREALKSGYCKPYEYRVVTKTGDLKWVLETVISINYQGKRATLGNFMDITEHKIAQEEIRQANEKLKLMVKKFENQSRLNSILAEMRDLLQACTSTGEIAPIIVASMKKLFPAAKGALFLVSPSRSDLESVARWGGFPEDVDDNVFGLDACWGLRRGRAHVVDDTEIGPICPHLKHQPDTAYVCLPLMAKGDVLGLLHLRSVSSAEETDKKQNMAELKDMAITISEYLSLAIANIKLSESLSRQSIQDILSGLYNRRYMEESLQREIQRASRRHTQIGIVMGDIDHFKNFNDEYGHAAGDMIISVLGKLLKRGIRGSDIACRYGGEEFVLILPDCSQEETFKRANNLREEVKKLEVVFKDQVLGSLTISMGIVVYPDDGTMLEDLLRKADIALYKAKQSGRNRVITS